MSESSKLVIKNVGQILSGNLEEPLLDGNCVIAVDGKIAAIGYEHDLDTENANTVVDAKGVALWRNVMVMSFVISEICCACYGGGSLRMLVIAWRLSTDWNMCRFRLVSGLMASIENRCGLRAASLRSSRSPKSLRLCLGDRFSNATVENRLARSYVAIRFHLILEKSLESVLGENSMFGNSALRTMPGDKHRYSRKPSVDGNHLYVSIFRIGILRGAPTPRPTSPSPFQTTGHTNTKCSRC